jgi:hypothetical protein
MARGIVVTLSVIAWMASSVPAARAGTPLCAFDEATGVVHVHVPLQTSFPQAPVVLAREGDTIVVDGTPCGTATVTTTERILVDAEQDERTSHLFDIDLSGGPFAPGRSDEGDGSSEIEIRVDMGPSLSDEVTIRGSDGPDVVVLRRTAVNLDAAPDDRPDLRLLGLHDSASVDSSLVYIDRLSMQLGAGDDRVDVDARGSKAPMEVFVATKAGADRIAARYSWYLRVLGGRDDDTLWNGRSASLFAGPGDDDVSVGPRAWFTDASGGSGDDVFLGGPFGDSFAGGAGRDRMQGFGALDVFYGAGGADRIDGGAGHDQLWGNQGRDRLTGGGGRDQLRGGPGRDRCDLDPEDEIVVGCTAIA